MAKRIPTTEPVPVQSFEERDVIADLILSACDEHDAHEVIDALIRSRWEQAPALTGWETVDTSIPREESEVR